MKRAVTVVTQLGNIARHTDGTLQNLDWTGLDCGLDHGLDWTVDWTMDWTMDWAFLYEMSSTWFAARLKRAL